MPGSKKFFTRSFLLAACFMAMTAHAAGDVQRGAVLADTCLGCHGIEGYRNAYPSYRVPKLGGQHEDYLILALQGYRNKARAHLTMQAQAVTLSDQDMRDLAAYFVSRGEPENGSNTMSGKGKEKASVCSACHGATGISPTPNWPSLAGQHEDYLKQVIGQYKNGDRKDPVMAGQVINLSEEDVADIAAYYAAQPGLFTATYSN